MKNLFSVLVLLAMIFSLSAPATVVFADSDDDFDDDSSLDDNDDSDEVTERARLWIKDLLEMQQETGSSLEFIENMKVDLFPDKIFTFTLYEIPTSSDLGV